MITSKGLQQTVSKQKRLVRCLGERIFVPVMKAEMTGYYETKEPLHAIPDGELFGEVPASGKWGGEGVYAWFRGEFTVPEELAGKALFAYPRMTFYESTMWINGNIHSNFAAKFVEGSHGNHYCNRISAGAKAGEKFDMALECYAYHDVPDCSPLTDVEQNFIYSTGDVDICVRDDEYMEFMFDLATLISLRDALGESDFRRAEVENALYQAHKVLFYDADAAGEELFREGLRKAWPYLKEQLGRKNGDGGAFVGLTGHSHMDTAWLWPLVETKKKCARTYANQINLMEEYPEYRFIQSSAYHGDIIRRLYPELFKRIQKAVAEGKYEPNGGVWVECDCNLTGGEYMLRQFLWGQRFTRKYFGYTSDTFWLPDTFGYSYAIPQIMKGCGVDYFLTTKMAWNDTNKFPYTSFYWQGLDGTRVLTHLNRTHIGPTPETLHEITDGSDAVGEYTASSMRLFSYGKGDGGGGPAFEEIEMARRLGDLAGVPRSEHMSVSQFMKKLDKTIVEPSVHADELYLELHRGTLTNQHEIKRGNRKLEIALHDLELAIVQDAVKAGKIADGAEVAPLMNTLLVRQFHDILPGTCINTVHEETRRVVGEAIREAKAKTTAIMGGEGTGITLKNTLGFDRKDVMYIPAGGAGVEGLCAQKFVDLDGKEMLAVYGAEIPALGSVKLGYSDAEYAGESAFKMDGNSLVTPFAEIEFDENGFIASMVDKSNGRQLVNGLPFGTFVMAEDVSNAWDNWDVDADLEDKFMPAGRLISREVISDGGVELRIRCKWELSEKCVIRQDMIFDAHSPMITFDTEIDWQEEHRFLKAAFDTSLHADGVRSEIQFGHIRRSNHRSSSVEKARFEICNHKYSDLSENSYGIALLNDCKYGLSAKEGSMRLSLHKGGIRPDRKGDKGVHRMKYAILPHAAGFGAESVIQPAYRFNYEPVAVSGGIEEKSLLKVGAANVIVEAVKPCEDAEKAYIVRLYEAAGDWVKTNLTFGHGVKGVYECSMLEEVQNEADASSLTFRPFEIKTIKVVY